MNRPEEQLHRACLAHLRATLPAPWIVWHTPNGGGRSKAEAGIFKALGTLAGMPDLFVMGPCCVTNDIGPDGRLRVRPFIVAIEFKAPPKLLRAGGASKAAPRLSPAQRARQIDLGACGVPFLVIDDLAEMVRALKALGVPLRGRVM